MDTDREEKDNGKDIFVTCNTCKNLHVNNECKPMSEISSSVIKLFYNVFHPFNGSPSIFSCTKEALCD